MKDNIRAGMRYLFFVVAGTLGVLFVAGILLVFDWPWWVGIFLLLLLAGLVLAGLFLRRHWLRRRERSCAGATLDEEPAKAGAPQDGAGLKALQERWKAAVHALCSSNLHKHGNPLYVLPWFLLIGDTGSGKSLALAGARLSSPLPSPSDTDGTSPTDQCDWWFFEHAVVIDTAGRYTVPINPAQDQEEWHKVLSLLVKYRRKEPLNGVVATVAADRLLDADEGTLKAEALSIRRRLDELMRTVGVKVPVYLLVTRCDLVRGMREFCDALPPGALDQAMGVLNQDPGAAESFAEGAFEAICERLRSLRLQLLLQPRLEQEKPELLLFPEEFANLKQGLVSFSSHAFGDNPYQEPPVLRGLFFGSARQEGKPRSRFDLPSGGSDADQPAPGSTRSFFLHDFFGKILPHDRPQLTPTRHSIHWRTFTGHLGLTSWVVLGISLCGLLSFSFVKNLSTIRAISHGLAASRQVPGEGAAGLPALEQFRQDILKVEQKNRNWWLPRFGLNESIKVEKGLKLRFCRQFLLTVQEPLDRELAGQLPGVSPATPDQVYGHYVVHLARRINLLKARLDGKQDTLVAKPRPATFLGQIAKTPTADQENGASYGNLYLAYLTWREDPTDLGKEAAILRAWLKQLLAARGDLHWLVSCVEGEKGLAPVTLRDFWGGSLNPAGEKSVPAAFSRKGKGAIDSLLGELDDAVGEPTSLSALKSPFVGWYRSAAMDAWHAFAADFAKGEERLGSPAEWQQVASRMATEQGAYFALLNRMALELQPLVGEASAPPWLRQVYQFEATRAQAQLQQHATVNQAAEGSRKILSTIRKNVGQEAGAQKLEAQIGATRACRDYCCALQAIVPAATSRSQAFQLASRTFGEDSAAASSPCYAAATAAEQLKAGLGGAAVDPVIAHLMEGPWDFFWSYLRRESAAQLQSLWEEQVLAGTRGMTDQQAVPLLLGPDGLAWRFVKGPAAPFLSHGVTGYQAKEVLRGKIPFENALYSFMNKGAKAQAAVMEMGRPRNVSVGISGLPTDTNTQAKVKPHATRLELHCGAGSQVLINNNYPVSRTFSWSPEACSDVGLQIEVGDQVLNRYYSGPQGFADFLKEFEGGRRTFAAREFPGEKAQLDRMGVRSITVNYRFMGSGQILQQAAALSGQAPRRIARGWTQ